MIQKKYTQTALVAAMALALTACGSSSSSNSLSSSKKIKDLEEQLAEAEKIADAVKLKEKYAQKPWEVTAMRDQAQNPDSLTDRELAESSLDADKFDYALIFDGESKEVDPSEPNMREANGVAINGKESGSFIRYDLDYSQIAAITVPYSESSDYTDVLVYAGKATDLKENSFENLKSMNKGVMTYSGKALISAHSEKKGSLEYARNDDGTKNWDKKVLKESTVDQIKLQNGGKSGDVSLSVDLENESISGNIVFAEDKVNITLNEASIKSSDNKLSFNGNLDFTRSSADNQAYAGENLSGTFKGVFMGPEAEEVAGSFDVVQEEYTRDDGGHPDAGDARAYEQFGKVEGVFAAEKDKEEVPQEYETK